MKSIDFPQRNAIVAENQDEYNNLYSFVGRIGSEPHEHGVVCCFELSDEEIADIVKNKRIWYSQLTFGKPMNPISMHVRKDLFSNE